MNETLVKYGCDSVVEYNFREALDFPIDLV